MTNEKINKILTEIHSSPESYKMKYEEDFSNYNEWIDYRKLLLIILYDDLKLTTKRHSDRSIYLSERGRLISENGGWLKHLESERDKKNKESRKLEYDLKISKLKSKTFFPVLILGAFGGIYSGYKLISDFNVSNDNQQVQETKVQTESEKTNEKSEVNYHLTSDSLYSKESPKTDSLKTELKKQ